MADVMVRNLEVGVVREVSLDGSRCAAILSVLKVQCCLEADEEREHGIPMHKHVLLGLAFPCLSM
jgi:hypothetical protein